MVIFKLTKSKAGSNLDLKNIPNFKHTIQKLYVYEHRFCILSAERTGKIQVFFFTFYYAYISMYQQLVEFRHL